MKARLIVDSLGPNPDYKLPERDQFPSDEAFHDAVALYDVPPEITVPAGTILSHKDAWIHCFPDASGVIMTEQRDPRDRKIKLLPRRVGVGIVRAVPHDEPCQAMLDKHIAYAAKSRGVRVDYLQREVAEAVQASLDRQAEIEANRTPTIPIQGSALDPTG